MACLGFLLDIKRSCFYISDSHYLREALRQAGLGSEPDEHSFNGFKRHIVSTLCISMLVLQWFINISPGSELRAKHKLFHYISLFPVLTWSSYVHSPRLHTMRWIVFKNPYFISPSPCCKIIGILSVCPVPQADVFPSLGWLREEEKYWGVWHFPEHFIPAHQAICKESGVNHSWDTTYCQMGAGLWVHLYKGDMKNVLNVLDYSEIMMAFGESHKGKIILLYQNVLSLVDSVKPSDVIMC